jgi:putative NIF3 family GTP cyclohydrolase 1 type 2
MATASEIIEYVERLTGHPLNRDEGVHHGSADAEVGSVVLCWMATSEAIEEAGRSGADLLIAHESLYYPYDAAVRDDNPDGWRDWKANLRRRELLEKHRLTLLRVHGSMDEICILDEFAGMLGLGEPVYEKRFVKVYEIEECTYGELIDRVKSRSGLGHVRCSLTDRLDRKVRRVGLPWGGLGLDSNVGYQQSVLEQGVDVLIAGESDNYGFRFSAEWDVPMVETSHETSENPGIRHFAEMLGREFGALAVRFYENECIWNWR